MKGIEVVEVDRNENKVSRVNICFNGYLYLDFIRGKNGFPIEVDRYSFGNNENNLWINKSYYEKIIRIVYAIFHQRKK